MNKINKPKLKISEQIKYLEEKGITFNYINKNKAENFLSQNSYLFKLKAYAKNYNKRNNNTYINLDFAYLVELSTIDMHLRKVILTMTLNIEHLLKTKLLRDFNSDDCDGYKIVSDFLNLRSNSTLKREYKNYSSKGFTAKDNILNKYKNNLSIWNLIEILEFKKFTKFCSFYYDNFDDEQFKSIKNSLVSVQYLRNSSAHNNCLINNLNTIKQFTPTYAVVKWVANTLNIKDIKHVAKKMQNPFINNFIVSILMFDALCYSKSMKKALFRDLIKVFKRAKRNKHYFKKNNKLTSVYSFLFEIILAIKNVK